MNDLRAHRIAAGTTLLFGCLAAPAQDMLAARSLAATCANCHGTNGQARSEMAALAGQPADKTIATLDAFRSGAKAATVMNQIVKGYSVEQLRLIATYFAAQPAPR